LSPYKCNWNESGIVIIGTFNNSASFSLPPENRKKKINPYNGEKLRTALSDLFHNVFLFSVNDEVVHTGFESMGHYLICIGCYKKKNSMKNKKNTVYIKKDIKKNSSTCSEIYLGKFLSYLFTNTPRRILYSMSYYKFASSIIGKRKRILDVGCGEGLGTWLLAVECGYARGIDLDLDSIKVAQKNWIDGIISFECSNFLNIEEIKWDAIVNFDVIEHMIPENVPDFFKKTVNCLSHDGITIIGTPNITSDQYANPVTRAGHINLYSAERLEKEMREYFHQVFIFAANDEIIHTGFFPMANYLIAIGCHKY